MDERELIEGYSPYYYWDIKNSIGLTVTYPEEDDEHDETLTDWQLHRAAQYNCWVDDVKVKLFLEGYHPAVELPYCYCKHRKATIVVYELTENEYSLHQVRKSYYSPRGWEKLSYVEEAFYPAVLIEDAADNDYWNMQYERHGLDEYGFLKNHWLLWWSPCDEYHPGIM